MRANTGPQPAVQLSCRDPAQAERSRQQQRRLSRRDQEASVRRDLYREPPITPRRQHVAARVAHDGIRRHPEIRNAMRALPVPIGGVLTVVAMLLVRYHEHAGTACLENLLAAAVVPAVV